MNSKGKFVNKFRAKTLLRISAFVFLLPLSQTEVKFFTKEIENQVKATQIFEKYLGSKYNRLTFALPFKKMGLARHRGQREVKAERSLKVGKQ